VDWSSNLGCFAFRRNDLATNLSTGLALKVIGWKECKRKRDRLEELERDAEILNEVKEKQNK
jgi:hypothetical protein